MYKPGAVYIFDFQSLFYLATYFYVHIHGEFKTTWYRYPDLFTIAIKLNKSTLLINSHYDPVRNQI